MLPYVSVIRGIHLLRHVLVGSVLLATCLYAQSVRADESLFEFDGQAFTSLDLPPKLRTMLYELDLEHFERRRQLAEELLFKLYLKDEAERTNTSTEQLAEQWLSVDSPSEDAVTAFYAANQGRIGKPLEVVRDKIQEHLRSQGVERKKAELLQEVKRRGSFKLTFEPPAVPPANIATEGYPSKGSENAPITIVEFGDYQCHMCKRAAAVMHRLLESYPEDVRIVFRDFPINPSGISRKVAEGAWCAHEQQRFWDFHDLAFDLQHELSARSSTEFADHLGFDMTEFKACLTSERARQRVASSQRDARRLGLSATPSVYVNGQPLLSDDLEKDLRAIVERKIAEREDDRITQR